VQVALLAVQDKLSLTIAASCNLVMFVCHQLPHAVLLLCG